MYTLASLSPSSSISISCMRIPLSSNFFLALWPFEELLLVPPLLYPNRQVLHCYLTHIRRKPWFLLWILRPNNLQTRRYLCKISSAILLKVQSCWPLSAHLLLSQYCFNNLPSSGREWKQQGGKKCWLEDGVSSGWAHQLLACRAICFLRGGNVSEYYPAVHKPS